MDNLDIVFIITDLNIGGTERHLVMVATALVERGASVDVYSLRGEGLLAHQLREAGVRVVADARSDSSVLGRWWRLRRWLAHRRPKLVHYFLPEAYILGSLSTPTACRRIMSRRSLNHYQKKQPVAARVERYCHSRLDRVLANADVVAAQLSVEGIDPNKIEVIRSGVVSGRADSPDKSEARAAVAVEQDAMVILMVANLIPYKGHADALQALHRFSAMYGRSWTALFVGEDRGCGRELAKRASALGLETNVRWCGQVTDIGQFLAAADIGLLTSHEEGMSTFILEAMAAGLPVVATSVGGNAEAIIDQRTGLLAAAADTEAIAAALTSLAKDTASRQRMGDAARLRSEQQFSVRRCIDAYSKVYLDVMRLSSGR